MMKVFISWSGELSKAVAGVLGGWLPPVIQSVEPFLSFKDIEKGKRWPDALGQNLEFVNVGILCLTADNLRAPWLLFESGALSKLREESRLLPLLIGVEKSNVEWPLAQFQLTNFEHDDVLAMLISINNAADVPIKEDVLEASFEKFWPDLQEQIDAAIAAIPAPGAVPVRSREAILEELLELARSQERTLSTAIGDRRWTFRGNAKLDPLSDAEYRDIALGLGMLKTLAEIESKDYAWPYGGAVSTLLKLRDPLEVLLARARVPRIHGVYFVPKENEPDVPWSVTFTED